MKEYLRYLWGRIPKESRALRRTLYAIYLVVGLVLGHGAGYFDGPANAASVETPPVPCEAAPVASPSTPEPSEEYTRLLEQYQKGEL